MDNNSFDEKDIQSDYYINNNYNQEQNFYPNKNWNQSSNPNNNQKKQPEVSQI